MNYSKKSRNRLYNTAEKYYSELTGRISLIEIHSNNELFVSGCIGILKYDSTEIILDTISGNLEISGENLYLETFQEDTLIIGGIIHKVNLEDYD